jgi:hypothetical protein
LKKIIILYLFITLNLFSFEIIGKINKSVKVVKYKNYIGYSIENLNILTDRKSFYTNISSPDKFCEWYIFVEDDKEIYKTDDCIKIVSDYNNYTDTIKYTIITPFIMAQIQDLIFSFKREKLFSILNSEINKPIEEKK